MFAVSLFAFGQGDSWCTRARAGGGPYEAGIGSGNETLAVLDAGRSSEGRRCRTATPV